MTHAPTSLFAHVPPYPGDPILSLMEAFQQDPRPAKVSLSIGLYFDEAGRLPVLDSVRRLSISFQVSMRSDRPQGDVAAPARQSSI